MLTGNGIYLLTKNSSGALELKGVPVPVGPSAEVLVSEIVSYCNDDRGGAKICRQSSQCNARYVEDCADQWAYGALDVMRGALGGEFGGRTTKSSTALLGRPCRKVYSVWLG